MPAPPSQVSVDTSEGDPLVTVVTPVYDLATYVEDAMASVLAQTYARLEYLVVDDGSTDGSAEIASKVAARDARVRVLVERHRGSGAARNAGLAQARGRYVAFLDGDDRWRPEFLRTMVDLLEAAPETTRAVFCRSRLFSDRQPDLGVHPFAPGPYGLVGMLAGWNPTGNGSCLLLRRDDLVGSGGFDEDLRSCVDLDMWLRILAAPAHRFLGVDDVLVDYRQRDDSISADTGGRFDALYAITSRYRDRVPPQRRRSFWYLIQLGYRNNRRREVLTLYTTALPWAALWAPVDPQWRRATVHAVLSVAGPRAESALRRVRARIVGLVHGASEAVRSSGQA